MKKVISILILGCGFCAIASADIWKWEDANGELHFVDSITPIYTWVDENGRIHYSDTPDHISAVRVKLVWHSPGDVSNESPVGVKTPVVAKSTYAPPDETEGERFEREQAEAYYCKRAKEIYNSYLTAPRLYETDAGGNRVYLSEADGSKLLTETKFKVDALCN